MIFNWQLLHVSNKLFNTYIQYCDERFGTPWIHLIKYCELFYVYIYIIYA